MVIMIVRNNNIYSNYSTDVEIPNINMTDYLESETYRQNSQTNQLCFP